MIPIETLDDWWKYVVDYLDKKKVQYFIHGSTLLGQIRNHKLLDRIPFDKELNFGMRAQDISQQFLSDLKHDFPYFQSVGDKKENSLIYFGPEPIIKYLSKNEDHWSMNPGIALIATFWEGKTKWIEYMGCDTCLTWPKEQLEEFNCIDLGGRRVSTPKNQHDWLSHYFGSDYMIENKGWHWANDSYNREKYQDMVIEEGL